MGSQCGWTGRDLRLPRAPSAAPGTSGDGAPTAPGSSDSPSPPLGKGFPPHTDLTCSALPASPIHPPPNPSLSTSELRMLCSRPPPRSTASPTTSCSTSWAASGKQHAAMPWGPGMRHGVRPAPCTSSTAPSAGTARHGEAPTWEGSTAGSAERRPLPIKEEASHRATWDCCWAGLGCTSQAGDGSSPPSCPVPTPLCSARAVL